MNPNCYICGFPIFPIEGSESPLYGCDLCTHAYNAFTPVVGDINQVSEAIEQESEPQFKHLYYFYQLFIKTHIQEGTELLEYNCRTGFLSLFLKDHYSYTGYDKNIHYASYWKEQNRLCTNKLPSKTTTLTIFNNFTHIKDPRSLLSQITHTYLILSLPILLQEGIQPFKQLITSDIPQTYLHYYSLSSLDHLLNSSSSYRLISSSGEEDKMGYKKRRTYLFKKLEIDFQ